MCSSHPTKDVFVGSADWSPSSTWWDEVWTQVVMTQALTGPANWPAGAGASTVHSLSGNLSFVPFLMDSFLGLVPYFFLLVVLLKIPRLWGIWVAQSVRASDS